LRGSAGIAAILGRRTDADQFLCNTAGMAEDLSLQALIEILPPRIWYLTSNGQDMWCRRPYGFLFSTGQAAETFARAMGTGEQLFAIGLDAGALLSDEILDGLRNTAVTRLFIDPAVDPTSGDVHGKILRLAPLT
jgi:hypothetical protein